MRENVYQTKYWYNYFNCVNRSISKILHYRATCPEILKLQNDSQGVTTYKSDIYSKSSTTVERHHVLAGVFLLKLSNFYITLSKIYNCSKLTIKTLEQSN